jgi:tRNA(Ile)-lysidine synthase
LLILDEDIKELLKKKNLLAFSAGIDSSALFFLLLENKINFDIIIVDYNKREQSKEEVKYANFLASKYDKKIYLLNYDKKINSNFEAKAREIRYNFFEKVMIIDNYHNIITAHQLNDKLEWFLMQFTKGAGLYELSGMQSISKWKNFYKIKPILNISRDEIHIYLKENNIKFFNDKSNKDEQYKRNFFRNNFSNKLIKEFKNGILNSFKYLDKDTKSLFKLNIIYQEKSLYVIKKNKDCNINIRNIDLIVKKLGFLISSKTKEEIKNQNQCVISHKIAISKTNNYIFISPYNKEVMNKKKKEEYRIKKIPPNIRGYIHKSEICINLN